MTYTTGSSITIGKTIPKLQSGEVYTPVTYDQIQIEIGQGVNTSVHNLDVGDYTEVAPTETTAGSITMTNVPLVDGLNTIAIKVLNLADADTSTSLYMLGRTTVYKITNATSVTI